MKCVIHYFLCQISSKLYDQSWDDMQQMLEDGEIDMVTSQNGPSAEENHSHTKSGSLYFVCNGTFRTGKRIKNSSAAISAPFHHSIPSWFVNSPIAAAWMISLLDQSSPRSMEYWHHCYQTTFCLFHTLPISFLIKSLLLRLWNNSIKKHCQTDSAPHFMQLAAILKAL